MIDGGSTKKETTTKVGPKDSTQKIAGSQVPSLDPKCEPKQTKITVNNLYLTFSLQFAMRFSLTVLLS